MGLALWNIGGNEADRDSARRLDSVSIEREPFRIRQLVIDADGSIVCDLGRDDRNRKPRPYKVHRVGIGIESLVVRGKGGLLWGAQKKQPAKHISSYKTR